MRGLVISVCLLVLCASSAFGFPRVGVNEEEDPEIPGDDIVCDEGVDFIPHQNCTKYYMCDNGVPRVIVCNAGLYFNEEIKACDHPHNVPVCVGGTRPPKGSSPFTQPPTEAPTTEAPPTEAPPTEPPPTEAPPTEPPPTEAPPTEPPPTEAPPTEPPPTEAPPTEPPPTEAPPTEPPPTEAPATEEPSICDPDGIYNIPVKNNCSAYIMCVFGQAFPRTCAEGLLFDRETLKCEREEVAKCEIEEPTSEAPEPTTEAPEPTTEEPIPSTLKPICENPDIVYNTPYPGNCSLYYICAFGRPVLESCASGLLFDSIILDCVREEVAKCYEEPTEPPPTTTTTTTTTAAPTTEEPLVCRPDEVYFVEVRGDCSKYILCAYGTPIEQECSGGTVFDPNEGKCVLEELYECPYPRPTTLPPQESTTINKFSCPEVPQVLVQHPDDCGWFYACRNGQFAGFYQCGLDFWFNSNLQTCVDQEFSDCEIRKLPYILRRRY